MSPSPKGIFGKEDFGDRLEGVDRETQRKKNRILEEGGLVMKLRLVVVLMGVAALSVISSCATAPKPLVAGELRLLSVQVPKDIKGGSRFPVTINFEANGEPEIRAACLTFSGDGPHCYKVKDVIYGQLATITVETQTNNRGTIQLECYVTYIRDGNIQATNVTSTNFQIAIPRKPSQMR